MTLLYIIGNVCWALILAHGLIFVLDLLWRDRNIALTRSGDTAQATRRRSNPPWYTRYIQWLLPRVPGGPK